MLRYVMLLVFDKVMSFSVSVNLLCIKVQAKFEIKLLI